MKVEGLNSVLATLKRLGGRHKNHVGVVVGFTQSYALHVHEDLAAHHPVGQAKYLEQPAREMKDELAAIVRKLVKKGIALEQALIIAGLRLQRAAQELVPVDTSALKASAFTCLEKDFGTVSAAAYSRSEAIRKSEVTREK